MEWIDKMVWHGDDDLQTWMNVNHLNITPFLKCGHIGTKDYWAETDNRNPKPCSDMFRENPMDVWQHHGEEEWDIQSGEGSSLSELK